MVAEGCERVVINPEALILGVVILPHALTLPVMALDSEMVVALCGQSGLARIGFEKALCEGYARRNSRTVHFTDGNGRILSDVVLLGGGGHICDGSGDDSDKKHGYCQKESGRSFAGKRKSLFHRENIFRKCKLANKSEKESYLPALSTLSFIGTSKISPSEAAWLSGNMLLHSVSKSERSLHLEE